jgi:5'-3' exoribonuclease 1
MGIPLYFRYLTQEYSNTVIDYSTIDETTTVANLFFDLNGLIHPCCEKARRESQQKNPEDLERKMALAVREKIEEIITLVKPTEMVMLSVDGVAPFAKIHQQRTRRYKSFMIKKLRNKILEKYEQETDEWDTNAISPGTPFMCRLMDSIAEFVPILEEKTGCRVVFSSSEEPGEGEHKILSYIKNHPAPEGSQVIYGLDADLIMLGLISNIRNILLFREAVHFGKVEEGSFLFLNIDMLRKALIQEMNQYIEEECPDSYSEQGNTLIGDYIYLCFMLGNDFIPHLPMLHIGLSGVQYLLGIYRDVVGDQKSILDGDGKPRPAVLERLFDKMAGSEDEMVANYYESSRRRKYRDTPGQSPMEKELRKIDFLPLLQPVKDTVMLNQKGWRSRYYHRFLRSREVFPEDIEELCQHYLEGLNWTFHYYTKGCQDWRWHFPYSCAPTSQDIAQYLVKLRETAKPLQLSCLEKPPLATPVQLLSMMPPSSYALIPGHCRKLMTDKASPIADYYPKKFHVEFLYKRYFHEAVLYLPKINIERIEEALQNV